MCTEGVTKARRLSTQEQEFSLSVRFMSLHIGKLHTGPTRDEHFSVSRTELQAQGAAVIYLELYQYTRDRFSMSRTKLRAQAAGSLSQESSSGLRRMLLKSVNLQHLLLLESLSVCWS